MNLIYWQSSITLDISTLY